MSKKKKITILLVTILSVIGITIVVMNAIGLVQGETRYEEKSDLATIETALKVFFAENERCPSEQEGLKYLLIKNYLEDEETLIDSWGKPYQYMLSLTSENTIVEL